MIGGFGGLGLPCWPGNDFYGGSGWTGLSRTLENLIFIDRPLTLGLPFEVGGQMGRFLLMDGWMGGLHGGNDDRLSSGILGFVSH